MWGCQVVHLDKKVPAASAASQVAPAPQAGCAPVHPCAPASALTLACSVACSGSTSRSREEVTCRGREGGVRMGMGRRMVLS